MSLLARSAPHTWDEFVALDEEDLRELIDGELVEVEVPTDTHEYIVGRIGSALTVWSDRGHGGRTLASGYKVRVSDRRGVMPDVQFYRQGNRGSREQQTGLVTGHPDLVVEVVSASSQRYDRVTKLHWYAELGVPEYWLIDPQARTLECLVLQGSFFSITASLADDQVFRPASFEGLELPLSKLWG